MSAPNLIGFTTMTGNTAVQAITTSATAIVTNSGGSNKSIKVNSLYVANVDGTNDADVTVDLYRSATAYEIASTITVPANSTIVIINKESYIYLEEGDSLRCTASANSDLEAVCSYEVIS